MTGSVKRKKRGFVMTGGGAKGLYEAGVIHAFHITGMEFDVITGSSIGAMNSIFFAEYLFQKRQLAPEIRQDPERAVEALDGRVKAFHHAWLQMPDKRVIDDSQQGPIGQIKEDLSQLNLSLPLLVQLAWWWTDPDRKSIPPAELWPGLARLGASMTNRLGGGNELLRILKYERSRLFTETIRTYLRRFALERSLIPTDQDHKLKDIFTQPVSPLRPEHLTGDTSAPDPAGVENYILVDPKRSLCEYDSQGISVRLTRANYRTGRLEISTYVPLENFARFMQKQAWRLQASDPEKIPVGSFRLQVPGNPNAINAALCSGRFPGVFAPYPIDQIYLSADPENKWLYSLLSRWLDDPELEQALGQAYGSAGPGGSAGHWNALYASWRNSDSMRAFFPQAGDVYVDGGAIDNTPSNSAVDYIKEWVERSGLSKREVALELYVIFLAVEPESSTVDIQDPAIFQVVNRTLDIMGVAKNTSDANTVQTINTFGQRSEDLAQALKSVLDNVRAILPGLPPDQKQQLQQGLVTSAKALGLDGKLGEQPEGSLERLDAWVNEMLSKGLPVEVDAVKIYPEVMPLDTLQFTERLGYRKENAIQMLTMGCYNTLWTLRQRLEGQPEDALDNLDQQTLKLAKKWMGIDQWPGSPNEQELLRHEWRCSRDACVFYAQHCAHGAAKRS